MSRYGFFYGPEQHLYLYRSKTRVFTEISPISRRARISPNKGISTILTYLILPNLSFQMRSMATWFESYYLRSVTRYQAGFIFFRQLPNIYIYASNILQVALTMCVFVELNLREEAIMEAPLMRNDFLVLNSTKFFFIEIYKNRAKASSLHKFLNKFFLDKPMKLLLVAFCATELSMTSLACWNFLCFVWNHVFVLLASRAQMCTCKVLTRQQLIADANQWWL